MADFWKDYDNGKFSVGGKKNEEKKKSTSFWDEYDSGKYTVGGNRGSNDIKKLEELLAEKGLGRTAYRLPESLSKPVADTRNESQKQYDEYLGTLRSSADIQKELNVVGDALKIERDKRRSYVRNQLRDGNDITMASGKPQANAELDSRISKLQKRYGELEQELKSNTYANYERNRLADDFAENSKYRSTDNGGAHSRMDLFGDTLITGYGNWKNEIINRNPDALAALNERTAGAGLATGASIDLPSLTGNDYSWTQSMTNDQISMYNYLANTKGAEEADKYLDYIRSDVYAADRARIESEAQAYANEHPVLASGKTVLQAPMKGITYVGQTIDYLADGKIDENAPYNRYSYEPTAMRNAVQKQVEDRWGGVGSFLYGTGMSMADFLFTGVISGGAEWVSLGLMGTGAAADTVLEAKSRGLSDDQAFALGTVAGAAEILTEKVSVDRVFGAIRDKNGWVGKNIKEVLLNLAGDIIAEGTEEAVSDVINCVADILAAGEKSEWETAIRTYREQNPGMTESDAFKYAFLDKMKEIGLDFLGGALSGFLMGTGASMTNTAITAAQQNREKSQGIELARQARKEAGTPGDFEFLPDNEGGFTLPTAAETTDTAEDAGEIRTGSEKQFDGTLPTAEESELESRIDAAETETEKTGLRYGVDQKEIDSAKRLSQATGMKISYFSQDAKNGTMDNGFYNPQTGEIQLNAKSKRKTAVNVSHELTHSFEGTDAYTALQEYAKGDAVRKGGDWNAERERIRSLYQRAGIDLPGESDIDAEITAQWMERNFGSEKAITEICRDNPSLAKKIRDGLDTIVLKLDDLSGRQTWYEAEEIRNVMATYDRMLERYEKDVQTKLETSRGAKTDAATDDAGAVQENATERTTGGETAEEFYARMEDAHNAGEIDDELWEDAQAIYDEWTSVGNGESTTVADDGPEGRLPKWFREKKEVLENAVTRTAAGRKIREEVPGEAADRTETEETAAAAETQQATATPRKAQPIAREAQPIVREAQPIVREAAQNRKAVLENENFRKWFGESKVVNDDGSPKIMYHGTSNGGFEFFDTYGKSGYGLFGMGAYFTENPYVAETYTHKGKGKNPMIYPAYLAISNPIDMDAPADIEAWKKVMLQADERFMPGEIDGLDTNEDVYRAVEEQVGDFEVPKYEGAEIMQGLLEGMGYDGITHMGGGRVNADDPRHRVYIAFDGGQVKSAVGNNGEYSAEDPNIHHSISRVTAGNADEVLDENGVYRIADDVAVKHSLSTWTETEKVNVRKALKEKGFESEDINKWISDMNTIAAIIGDDRARLDFEANPDQTFVKPNQEYRYTVDASTLCAKRLLYTGTFDAIQHALPNTVLNSDDVLALMNMMKDAGYEAPCSVCYVESRRRNTGRFAKKWLDSYSGDYKPRIDELTTVDGREKLEREHPQAYNDFMNAMNRIGTNNPKITQTRTEYRGEIRKFSDTLVETLNEAGGLRLQSFSDFETPHLLDMMQVVTDMSARGLTSQAYTKIPAFARVFGGTGIKINLSLIADGNGFDGNGNLAFSSREGMDIDEAMEIREKYGENVGTIIVGVNDKHILACMADDRIDFIIPFHKSGWGKAQIAQMGMEAYMDYTRFQNEKDITTGKKVRDNIQPLDYWDFGVSGKENAETYLRLCAEQGRIPKFSRFLQDNGDGSWSLQADGSTDGYWKLLTDYKMYDNDGNGAPQRLVRPDIDMDAAREILEDYKGGANSLPVAQDIVDRFVAQKRGGVQHSITEEEDREAQIHSAAFKKWFGDWENDPENASAVVNEDGTPKIMYHGTASGGFNIFDTYNSNYGLFGIGSYFTDNEEVARGYSLAKRKGRTGEQKIYSVYLSIKYPFDMDAEADIPLWIDNLYTIDKENDGFYGFDLKAFKNKKTNEELYKELEVQIGDLMLPRYEFDDTMQGILVSMGYDGITHIGGGRFHAGDGVRHRVYIAFYPEQIKSASGNNGEYNPDDPNIFHSVSDENETGPIYELPAKARSNALKIEAQLARRLDSALDLELAGPNGGMTDALKQFRMEQVRPIVESFLRGEEPETAALWTEYSTDPLQQHAFDAAFEEAVPALERIRGYSERVRQEREAREKRNAELDAQIPTETEDLVRLAESVKQAKRNLSTIRGRLMLTEQDQQTVRNLLSGEMTEAQVQSTSPENADQIIEAANAEREYRSAVAPWARYTQRLASRRRAEADKHLEDAAKWKDKTAGWKYDRETAERNIRDIVPDAATADALVRDYFRPVHTAEAKSTRFKNDYIRRVQGLKLGMKATGNNTASESYAVQYLGEAEDNIRYLKTIRSPKAVRDGHNLQEWQTEVEAFKADNPDMDWAKVNKGIQEFSTIYGELIGQMNGVLVENGYMPVNVRRGYFPHFNGGEDTIMARFGNLLGMKINTAALPTSINGLTAGFKPGKTWFGHAQERLGFQTTYDAVQGFQNYIGGVADVIHQTDNLRNLRALATQVRYRTSDEQIQNQIDEIMANDTLDEAERQTLVDALKQNGRYQLSNFVAWLDEYTNLLANKKSKFDRGVEDLMGRGFYAGMKNLEGRVAANMISANLGSALTNFIPLNQASAMLGDRNVLRGMYQTVRGYASDDGFRDRSDFLVNRRGTDPLYQKTSQKISEFLSTPMNLIDNFTSESIVRAAYNRYRNQGMDAEEAMTAADEFAAGVMADRSKGAQPVIFGSRNPLLKLFTQFQVEVNNEYSTIFKDIPRDYKDKAVWILLRYFLGAYLFNDLYEKVVGRRAALDPVDLINETVGGLTGYQAPNTVDLVGDLIGGEDIDWGSAEDREDPYQAVSEFLSDAAEELPFIGGVAGGGRIPISSAMPDKDNMMKALLSTSWSPKKRLFTAGQEIGKSIGTYVIPPFAGGFGKKIAETAVNMARGGRYTVDKDGNDVLQYPYYTDDGAVGTAMKSALFGPTATEGGQEWIESGFKSLSAEQTSDYQGLTNYGADQRRAYEVAQMPGSKKADKIAKYRASIDLVDSADDKDSVFEFMADDKDANKFRAAKRCAGLDAETYVGWLEFLPRYDADGNGSMTQAETITAIDDYARKVGLTYPERAALYQLQGTTWKENPYDNEVGAAIKAMLGK